MAFCGLQEKGHVSQRCAVTEYKYKQQHVAGIYACHAMVNHSLKIGFI